MWVLDLFLGAGVCFLLYRAGLPSLFPLLILVPFFPNYFSWPALAGMIGVFLSESAPFLPIFFPWKEWSLIFSVSALGLLSYSFLSPFLPLLERFIPFLLVGGLLALLVSQFPKNKWVVPSLALCLLAGFFVFSHAVIALSLPAWLAGFFGLSFSNSSTYHSRQDFPHQAGQASLGVLTGLLPGLGPGLVGLIWSSARALPFLSFANLVFSLGLISLSSRVRSFPAAALSFQSLPEWPLLLLFLFLGILLASSFRTAWAESFPFLSFIPAWVWTIVFLLFLLFFGGLSTFLVWALAFALARILKEWNVSPSLGLAGLIPSIFWFYSAGFF